MNDTDRLTSRAISWLRFPLIMCVLIIHSNFSVVIGGWGNQPVASWVSNTVSHFAFICNPAFFFISGYLFFRQRRFDWHIYVSKLKRRVHSLLIPYIVWNSLFLLILFIMETMTSGATAIIDKPVASFSLSDFLYAYVDISQIDGQGGIQAPVDVPLWYVRNLMGIVLFSPVIYLILKMLSMAGKTASFVVLVILLIVSDSYAFSEIVNDRLFFSIGAFIAINDIDVVSGSRRRLILLLAAAVTAYLANQSLCFYLFAILCLFRIVGSLLSRGLISVNKLLVSSSFFVFASHELVQGVIYLLIRRGFLVFDTELSAILCYVISPIVMSAVCVGAFVALRKLSPVMLKYLTGDRVYIKTE